MPTTWIEQAKRQPLIVAGVAVLLITVTFAATSAIRGNATERFAIGTWNCSGSHVDTPRPRDAYVRDAALPEPFQQLTDEVQPSGLYVYPYRPPQSEFRYVPFSAAVSVHPDGRLELTGIEFDGTSHHTGTWSHENGVYVVRFDTDMPNHAIHLAGETDARVLAWDDRSPKLFDIQMSRHEQGVDVRFSTGVEGYEARCVKLVR